MEPFDEGFAGFTDPSTASLYGLPAQPLDTGYYADGTQAYDRSDAGYQGGVAGGVVGGAVGTDLAGPVGTAPGTMFGAGIGRAAGGALYDAYTNPSPVLQGDYGTPPDGTIDPYTGVGP
ncbi:hypothetical protein [Methylobacterium fujisawaense]|uniref:hypothetical protein n=1 Tax=Methylobacterium fujisawaense TaxID=107400 RepID=UPI00344431F7